MARKYDVVSVGIAAVDDLLYVAEYPPSDCKIPVNGSTRQGGGPACTATAAIGALGGSAAYVARFGANDLSRFIEHSLQRLHVDTSHLLAAEGAGPYHSVIVVDSHGSRNVFYDAGLYQVVAPEQMSNELMQSASLLLLDHITEPSLLPIAQKARQLGVPALGDIEGRTETSKAIAELMDYLVVPKEWALWATGTTTLTEACAALAATPRRATVVTDAANGCCFQVGAEGAVQSFPAFKVEVFDTNGCGDSFHGGFALAVARNLAVEDAILFATAVAALKAQAAGGKRRGWEALPALEEVFAFLEQRLSEPERASTLARLAPLGTQQACAH